MQLAVGHRYTHWRELIYNNKLHMLDRKRLTMGKACLAYFPDI